MKTITIEDLKDSIDVSNFPKVEVRWLDSGTFDSESWSPVTAITSRARLSEVRTSGYLIHIDEETLYVATSHDPDRDYFFGAQGIARKSIIEITTLWPRHQVEGEGLQVQRRGEDIPEPRGDYKLDSEDVTIQLTFDTTGSRIQYQPYSLEHECSKTCEIC